MPTRSIDIAARRNESWSCWEDRKAARCGVDRKRRLKSWSKAATASCPWPISACLERPPASGPFPWGNIEFAVKGDTVTLTHGGVNAAGQAETGTLTFEADGKERPVSEQAPGVVGMARWVGSHVLETGAKKDGQTIGRGKYEVSADGKTLTATVSGLDASGGAFEQVIVFDRK